MKKPAAKEGKGEAEKLLADRKAHPTRCASAREKEVRLQPSAYYTCSHVIYFHFD